MHKQVDILVIDDEQIVIDSIRKTCAAEGMLVNSALDALTALADIEKTAYRLIICDVIMPNLDGFQFLARLQARQNHTPVIITSGYTTIENAVKSLNSGAIDFLAKPFTVDELLSVVYRGLKYAEIQRFSNITDSNSHKIDMPLIYVTCPPKYFRLGYTTWLCQEHDGFVKIGVTDLFLHTISAINQITSFNPDEEIVQGNICAYFETAGNLIHQVLSPVSGRIISKNDALLNEPDLIMKDPYFEGWLYTVVPANPDYEIKHLTPCSAD